MVAILLAHPAEAYALLMTLLLAVSEGMGLFGVKSNGILDGIVNVLKKLQPPVDPAPKV